MISGQWSQRKDILRICLKNIKLPSISLKYSGTPILTSMVGLHTGNIHTKFEANPCIDLR